MPILRQEPPRDDVLVSRAHVKIRHQVRTVSHFWSGLTDTDRGPSVSDHHVKVMLTDDIWARYS